MVPANLKVTAKAREVLERIERQLFTLEASSDTGTFPSTQRSDLDSLYSELLKLPVLSVGDAEESVQQAWAKEYRNDVISAVYPNLTGGEVILDGDEFECESKTIDALPTSWTVNYEEDDFRCEINLKLWTVRGGVAIYKAELGESEIFRHVDRMAEYGLRIADFVS